MVAQDIVQIGPGKGVVVVLAVDDALPFLRGDFRINLSSLGTLNEGAIAVRFRVFVAEQQVPAEEELDEFDATATHAIAVAVNQGDGGC